MTLVSRNLLVVTSTRSIHTHCKRDPMWLISEVMMQSDEHNDP